MVGTLAGTDGMFKGAGYVGVESHFGTGYINGKITGYQWGDTARTADANLDANDRAISIENADTGDPFPQWTGENVPAFTAEQAELIAQITAWACKTHDIPATFAADSLPSRRGIAYHRQGIDPWRVAGGESWSPSAGKICPGDRRIEQIHSTIIPRVQQILDGGTVPQDPPDVEYPDVLEAQFAQGEANRLLTALQAKHKGLPKWKFLDAHVKNGRAAWSALHALNYPPK